MFLKTQWKFLVFWKKKNRCITDLRREVKAVSKVHLRETAVGIQTDMLLLLGEAKLDLWVNGEKETNKQISKNQLKKKTEKKKVIEYSKTGRQKR